jgi:hypothetical protein
VLLRKLFETVVARCMKAGIVGGERPHCRAVKIDDAQEVFLALRAEEGSAFGGLFMVLTAARPILSNSILDIAD